MISHNVGILREISENVLGDVARIADRFENHGKTLASAAHMLEDANRTVDATVDERRAAIEAIASDLITKSESIGEVLKSFTGVISNTLDSAEDKARDVSAMLSEAAETASKNVVEQFESMRLSAGLEGQRAQETVRSIQTEMLDEMNRSVSEASERFTEATGRMRDIAREMQNELQSTRAEMKRGIFELPQEAEESTSAMRRVVSEQIRALNELSEIVARQANTLDVSQPNQAAQAGGRRDARPAARAAAPAPAPVAPVRSRPEPVREAPRQAPASSNDPIDFARPKPSRPSVADTDDQNRGWMADLLRRASRDDETPAPAEPVARRDDRAPTPVPGQRSPLHMVESLNSLSVDIARAIDHEAFLDLWQRYQRGERNAFTRRLYTLQGQQTFDEIRRKYQRDPEFRSAVDRYLEDFESLIAEVSRDDRDNMLSQTYLTSDTGKVYTMLAHASGRFG